MIGHAKLEGKDCLKCHEAGKGVTAALCMECHKEIKTQVLTTKKGFHYIANQNKSCTECHSDHKGRDYDSTKIDQKTFDHFAKLFFVFHRYLLHHFCVELLHLLHLAVELSRSVEQVRVNASQVYAIRH